MSRDGPASSLLKLPLGPRESTRTGIGAAVRMADSDPGESGRPAPVTHISKRGSGRATPRAARAPDTRLARLAAEKGALRGTSGYRSDSRRTEDLRRFGSARAQSQNQSRNSIRSVKDMPTCQSARSFWIISGNHTLCGSPAGTRSSHRETDEDAPSYFMRLIGQECHTPGQSGLDGGEAPAPICSTPPFSRSGQIHSP
jgi:hypothetical protein